MKKLIPKPIIAVLSGYLPVLRNHNQINQLFLYADAPGNPPEDCTKEQKVEIWLRRINEESETPLAILGKIIEPYLEQPPRSKELDNPFDSWKTKEEELEEKLREILTARNITYLNGGILTQDGTVSQNDLAKIIKTRNVTSINEEFNRALKNISQSPKEAASAACNILESLFKVFIEDNGHNLPAKQDVKSLWKVIQEHLNFDPKSVEDLDLKKTLSGLFSIVDGIGAFRTHASSAHGHGRKLYNLKPRHARLVVNAAHSLVLFILETWDEKSKRTNKVL